MRLGTVMGPRASGSKRCGTGSSCRGFVGQVNGNCHRGRATARGCDCTGMPAFQSGYAHAARLGRSLPTLAQCYLARHGAGNPKAAVLLDGLEHDVGPHPAHVRVRQQALVHELGQLIERAHAQVQQIVGLAGDRMRLQHLVESLEEMREVLGGRVAVLGERDSGEHLDRVTELARVEIGPVGADVAGLLEARAPARALGRREADALGQLGVGETCVLLQGREQPQVCRVQAHYLRLKYCSCTKLAKYATKSPSMHENCAHSMRSSCY
jgi:hypothetical protein